MSIGFHLDDDEHEYDDDHTIGICFDSDYNRALMESNYDNLVKKNNDYDILRKAIRDIHSSIKARAEEYHKQSTEEYRPVAKMLLDRIAVGLLEASVVIEDILKQHQLTEVLNEKNSV